MRLGREGFGLVVARMAVPSRGARQESPEPAKESGHLKGVEGLGWFFRRRPALEYALPVAQEVPDMSLRIGDVAPDFEAETTDGHIRFHEWIGDKWAIIFSHPKDFTPVCTTELGYMAKLKPEFDKRNTKIIGLSVDPVDNHAKWAADIAETQGAAPNYPMIGDTDLSISKLYNMLPAESGSTSAGRTAMDNMTVRTVFVIGPDKKIKLMISYPMTTGRNFDEVLRVLDSIQMTAKHRVATPVNWKQGDDVIIVGAVSDDEARKIYPDGWKAPRPYLRIVPQPK
jgi:alkyl hydroperoxide reductase subunit AhpC